MRGAVWNGPIEPRGSDCSAVNVGDGGSIDRLEFHAGGGRRRNLTEELFEIWYELLLDGLRELQSAGVSNVHFRDFLGIPCHNGIRYANKII